MATAPSPDSRKVDETLIHAVEKGHVCDATKILAEGANPNCRYPGKSKPLLHRSWIRNDTPMHIAARNGSTILVKLLIVFDANLSLKNDNEETPLDVAKDECGVIIETVLTLRMKLSETRDCKTAKPTPKPYDNNVFLLCLDGGGIRGLVFIQVLIELDKRRKQLYPASESFLSYFNWMAGTSTGGIAALTLATQGRNPINGRQMYFKLKDKALKGIPPFPNDQVNKAMQNIFGDEKVMGNIKDVNVAVMTTLAETKPPKLHIMRTYGGIPDDDQRGPDKRRIWEAARATSAAVPYFHPFGKFIDGGFISNNPTVDALVDIQRHFKKQQQKVNVKAVISLGCGCTTPEQFVLDKGKADSDPEMRVTNPKILEKIEKDQLHRMNRDRPRVETDSAKISKTKDFIRLLFFHPVNTGKVIQLCISQTTQPSGEVVKRGEAFAEALGAKYSRVSPELTENVDFIETDDKQLIEMLYSTVLYMLERHNEKMDQVLAAVMEN